MQTLGKKNVHLNSPNSTTIWDVSCKPSASSCADRAYVLGFEWTSGEPTTTSRMVMVVVRRKMTGMRCVAEAGDDDDSI